jgi:mRNA interferase RelE/StbE
LKIEWTRSAEKDLAALDKAAARRVRDAVVRFGDSGHGDVKALAGADAGFRLRVGSYRVLFDSDGETVSVLAVAHRKEAYR